MNIENEKVQCSGCGIWIPVRLTATHLCHWKLGEMAREKAAAEAGLPKCPVCDYNGADLLVIQDHDPGTLGYWCPCGTIWTPEGEVRALGVRSYTDSEIYDAREELLRLGRGRMWWERGEVRKDLR